MTLSIATLKTASSAPLETIRFVEDSTRPDEIVSHEPILRAGMDFSGDDHIAHLLRLKRYEQPPPNYFENFLHEFHRRQRERDELLRQPRWRRIWFERGRYSVFWHNLWPLAYTGAAMVALVAGSVVISMTHQQPDTTQLAVQASAIPIRPSIIDKQVEFEPASFDMQAAVLPGSSDLLVLPASDEPVPLNLEWESVEDQSLLASP
jgi:hypothetical protein